MCGNKIKSNKTLPEENTEQEKRDTTIINLGENNRDTLVKENMGSNYTDYDESNTVKSESIDIREINVQGDDTAPNGGYGWVVSIAGFLVCFMLYGLATIWGVFSNAYSITILKDKATTLELTTVGGFYVIGLGLFSPLSPALIRFGTHFVMLLGTVVSTLSLILASFSSEAWHLFLTQGLMFGCGVSLVYMTSISVIAQWFTYKRGAAMGISSAGTGVGGLVLGPFANYLIQKYGIAWAYRILGFISFGVCLIATSLVRTRLPSQENRVLKRPSVNFSILKEINFIIWLIGSVIGLMGYFVFLYYIARYSAAQNVNSTQSAILIGVSCATNAIGRIVLGYIADYTGRLNMYIITSASSGLFCMLFWPFAKTFGSIMAFSILFGFTCGLYYTLAPPITATIVGQENISSGVSILFVASVITGVGPTIASSIQSISPGDGFIGVQMFSGSAYLFASALCILLKFRLTGTLFSIY